MKRNVVIFYAVVGILASIVAIVALSMYGKLADLWLPVVLVLATSVTELIKSAVEIAKVTHERVLDEEGDEK